MTVDIFTRTAASHNEMYKFEQRAGIFKSLHLLWTSEGTALLPVMVVFTKLSAFITITS